MGWRVGHNLRLSTDFCSMPGFLSWAWKMGLQRIKQTKSRVQFVLYFFRKSNLFLNVLFICSFISTTLDLSCCTWAFSSCIESQKLRHQLVCGMWFSHCGVFSYCREWALGTQASYLRPNGLKSCGAQAWIACSMWNLQTRDQTASCPAMSRFLATGPPNPPCV